MKVKDVIDKLAELKPHQFSDAVIVAELTDIERTIWNDVISWHEGDVAEPSAYDAVTDADTVLLIPEPYSKVYILYIAAQIDYWSRDASYKNSMIMYNKAYSDMANWYNRTHMPKQTTTITI